MTAEPTAPDLSRSRAWQRAGEEFVAATMADVSDAELAEPSGLPGWTRAHVLGHLARNADGLGNLLTWARTGVETPMYASPDAREAGIEQTAARPRAELRADVLASARRLSEAMDALPAQAWASVVRTNRGRPARAATVPWMRVREVWVHGVDLAAGPTFADVPVEIATALLVDALQSHAGTGTCPPVHVTAIDAAIDHVVNDGTIDVTAPLAALLGWALGRTPAGDWPALPAWL